MALDCDRALRIMHIHASLERVWHRIVSTASQCCSSTGNSVFYKKLKNVKINFLFPSHLAPITAARACRRRRRRHYWRLWRKVAVSGCKMAVSKFKRNGGTYMQKYFRKSFVRKSASPQVRKHSTGRSTRAPAPHRGPLKVRQTPGQPWKLQCRPTMRWGEKCIRWHVQPSWFECTFCSCTEKIMVRHDERWVRIAEENEENM